LRIKRSIFVHKKTDMGVRGGKARICSLAMGGGTINKEEGEDPETEWEARQRGGGQVMH